MINALLIYLAVCLLILIAWTLIGFAEDFKGRPDHKFGYNVYDVRNKELVIFKSMYMFMGLAFSLPIINIVTIPWMVYADIKQRLLKRK